MLCFNFSNSPSETITSYERFKYNDILVFYLFFTGIRSVQYLPRPLRPKVNFVADHPFIVFIISNTGTILFMGRLSQP